MTKTKPKNDGRQIMGVMEAVARGISGERVIVQFNSQAGSQVVLGKDKVTGEKVSLIRHAPLGEFPSDDLVALVRAYNDHEIAHVLFTDEAIDRGKGLKAHLANALEDSRVNREMGAKYHGAHKNIELAYDILEKKYQGESKEMREGLKGAMAYLCVLESDHEKVFEQALDGNARKLLGAIADEIEAARVASSTEEVLALTEAIYEKWGLDEPESASGDNQDEQEENPDGESQGGSGNSGNVQDGDGEEGDSVGAGEGEDQEEDGEGSEGDGEAGGDDDGAGNEGSDSDENGDGDGAEEEKEPANGQGGDGESGDSKEELAKIVNDDADGLDDGSTFDLASAIDHARTSELSDKDYYRPYTELDEIGVPIVPRNHSYYADGISISDRRAEIKRGHAKLRRQLMLDLLTVPPSVARNLVYGTLDDYKLVQAYVGKDEQVFKRRRVVDTKQKINTSVSLLIDFSNSMNDGKIQTAMALASVFSEALDGCGIPNEVLGFTTGGGWHDGNGQLLDEGYTRVIPLRHVVVKGFNEKYRKVSKSFEGCPSVMAYTILGEAVLWAAKRILARHEMRKVLLVFTDGAPCGHCEDYAVLNRHLVNSVELVARAGVEVVGIGIETDYVGEMFPQSVHYEGMDTFASGFLKRLSVMLKGGQFSKPSKRVAI